MHFATDARAEKTELKTKAEGAALSLTVGCDPNHSDSDAVCVVILQLTSPEGPDMADALADSTARLERLVGQIMKEKDPEKCDELAAEIWRVLKERDRLKSALAIQKQDNDA